MRDRGGVSWGWAVGSRGWGASVLETGWALGAFLRPLISCEVGDEVPAERVGV